MKTQQPKKQKQKKTRNYAAPHARAAPGTAPGTAPTPRPEINKLSIGDHQLAMGALHTSSLYLRRGECVDRDSMHRVVSFFSHASHDTEHRSPDKAARRHEGLPEVQRYVPEVESVDRDPDDRHETIIFDEIHLVFLHRVGRYLLRRDTILAKRDFLSVYANPTSGDYYMSVHFWSGL